MAPLDIISGKLTFPVIVYNNFVTKTTFRETLCRI